MTRLLVPQARYEEAARRAVEIFAPGDPMRDETRLGPLISRTQRDRIRAYIRKGVEEGGELLLGGTEPPAGLERGCFVQPSLFGRVKPGIAIEQEEIVGPVLSVIAYRDEGDAVRIANDTIHGLAGAVWSTDEERACRVARRIRAGKIDA